jgi:hypothetical protein
MGKKPHGRRIKKQVGKILLSDNRRDAFDQLKEIPEQVLSAPLFSYFYSLDDIIKFRSTAAMGALVQRMAAKKIEDARIILRRLMWNLNDESGGIGWGSVEAMGEILSLSKPLAKEFQSILFSYINPGGTFLEHEMLQRGSLWGVGTYIINSGISDKTVASNLLPFLNSDDPVKRGYAVRAIVSIDNDTKMLPDDVLSDNNDIPIFDGWDFRDTKISAIVQGALFRP